MLRCNLCEDFNFIRKTRLVDLKGHLENVEIYKFMKRKSQGETKSEQNALLKLFNFRCWVYAKLFAMLYFVKSVKNAENS